MKIVLLMLAAVVSGFIARDAHADASGYICAVTYVPPTDPWAGGYGQNGHIAYTVTQQPSCGTGGWSQDFALCSKGATSPLCQSSYTEAQLLAVTNNLVQAATAGTVVYTYTDTVTYTKAVRVSFRPR